MQPHRSVGIRERPPVVSFVFEAGSGGRTRRHCEPATSTTTNPRRTRNPARATLLSAAGAPTGQSSANTNRRLAVGIEKPPRQAPIGGPAYIIKKRKDLFIPINAGKYAFRPPKSAQHLPYSGGTTFLSSRPPRSLKTKYPAPSLRNEAARSRLRFEAGAQSLLTHYIPAARWWQMHHNAPKCTVSHQNTAFSC